MRLQRIIFGVDGILLRFQLRQPRVILCLILKIFKIFLGLVQCILGLINVLLICNPFPLARRSVVLPDRPFCLRSSQIRLRLLNGKQLFFELNLLVLLVLLLFQAFSSASRASCCRFIAS